MGGGVEIVAPAAGVVLEGLWLDQDTDSSKFQEYRDLSDGFRVQLGLTGMTPDGKRRLDFQVVNGGKDDAFYGLAYDVAGSCRITSYNVCYTKLLR